MWQVSANLFSHHQSFVSGTIKLFYEKLYIIKSPSVLKIEVKTINYPVKIV